jgi:hypothetical protein
MNATRQPNHGRRARLTRPAGVRTVAFVALMLAASLLATTRSTAGGAAAPIKLRATLGPSSNQEVKRPLARGSFTATYFPADRLLRFRLTYTGLSGPVLRADLHLGAVGSRLSHTGRLGICDGPGNQVVCMSGKMLEAEQVFPDFLNLLARKGGYIELHTYRNTEGEAIGKIRVTR